MTPLLPLLLCAFAATPEEGHEQGRSAAAQALVRVTDTPPVASERPRGPIADHVPWAAADALPPLVPPPTRTWTSLPVARTPHPVAHHYGRRFQSLVQGVMGGPRASPVFGPTVAEADVHWRLLDATGRGLDLLPSAPERWREAALAASLLASEKLLDETVQRAPTLYGVYVAGDTLLSPSFDFRGLGSDKIELSHRGGGAATRALERAEEELVVARAARRPTPTLGVGLDWELRDDDAPDSAPLVQYTAWLGATEVGLTSMRLEIAPATLAWNVSGKQELRRGELYLIGSARSVDRSYEVGRLSGGLMWMLPLPGSCNVRGERILSLEEPDDRWLLTLRCENRTPIPAPLDPPLGDRGRGGPTLPWAPERGANDLVKW